MCLLDEESMGVKSTTKENIDYKEYGRLQSGAQDIWHETKYYWHTEWQFYKFKKNNPFHHVVWVTQQQANSVLIMIYLSLSADFGSFLTWSCWYSPSRHFHSSRTTLKPWDILWTLYLSLTADTDPLKVIPSRAL